MKHKTYFFVYIAMLVIMGCKIEKKSTVAAKQAQKQARAEKQTPSEPQPLQPVITRELHLEDVKIEFDGQPQPNVYHMKFLWPVSRDSLRVSLNGQQAFLVSASEHSEESIHNLQGGSAASVFIEILDEKHHVISSEVRALEVPKDYIFPYEYKLTSHMKIERERVFLNNSMITTEDYQLEIYAKKLIVLNRSQIQNFMPGARAQHGKAGRSGGKIRIEVISAEGDLTFLMNSEAGGDALKGFMHQMHGSVPPDGVCPFGSNGFAAGKNGDLILRVQEITNFHSYPQETLSEGGRLAPVLLNPDPTPDYPRLSMSTIGIIGCPKRPSPGAGAVAGKICLTFSGQVPQAGCE